MVSGPADGPVSIRRRLLLFLIGALALMVVGVAVVTYLVAVRSANDAYDSALLDPVRDISDNIKVDNLGSRLDMSTKALESLLFDQADRVIYQVRATDGTLVDGVENLPPPPELARGNHLFFDTVYEGAAFRVAALRTPIGFVIQVGETLNKRNRLVRQLLVAELTPILLVAVASIALAWAGVARGLQPLEHARAQLLRRRPADLQPISDAGVPIEIHPVIDAFNQLLGQLRAGNALQQRFLANAAHQLRTPLAGLQMHLELLLREALDVPVRTELERMRGATARASRLVNQLLALAKAESPVEPDQVTTYVDLMAIADLAARAWAGRSVASNIDLGFSLATAPVSGDPLLLPELLDNLIDNALRYTPAGGTVTVSTGQLDGASFLRVEDSGPGIPPAERDKVFERFYRVPGAIGEGSGLGLAVVKEIAERHRGTITIVATTAGNGTGIVVSFPTALGRSAQ
jgi:two-component system sensor histidine kinase TctE